jgi:molybdate/tungstate transport system ATP-binding protein
MAEGVAVRDLTLRVGAFRLAGLDFAIGAGETLVILGPNGAGKSVSLETIAGFHRPQRGEIRIAGREVTGLPPERRNVAFVYQNFGLFPHLSVAANIRLALHAKRRRNGRGRALEELLAEFGIAHLAGRDPGLLSPGEKQRVALARALAAEPDLFLFDEPFSALDAATRDRLRGELASFLRKEGVAAIFVTHDFADALALADRIAVMRAGRIVQEGPAREVFRAPQSRFVAEFLGIENILPGRLEGAGGVRMGGARLQLAEEEASRESSASVLLCIRAEDIELEPRGEENRLSARVLEVTQEGILARVALDCGFPLLARTMRRDIERLGLAAGAEIALALPPEAIHVIADLPEGRG